MIYRNAEPLTRLLLNPHGSDETIFYINIHLFENLLLNPHGSDETKVTILDDKDIAIFLTHTVQMKQKVIVPYQ